jgi:hypothetical protein
MNAYFSQPLRKVLYAAAHKRMGMLEEMMR